MCELSDRCEFSPDEKSLLLQGSYLPKRANLHVTDAFEGPK